MALPTPPAEIQRLIRAAENSRRLLTAEAAEFRHRIDVPARMKKSLKESPFGWLAGSASVGLATSFFLGGRRKKTNEEAIPVKRGLSNILLSLGIAAAKPLARMWLADRAKLWLAGNLPVSSGNASSGLPNRRQR